MSFSICNLPPEYRYHTSNLMCVRIMPGPKEQTPDQVQRFLRPIVSDLLHLWKHGIKVPTESHPELEGRLVRVALVAIICDKPTAHKMGGFPLHSHTNFCTECWISTKDKPEGKPRFMLRTNQQQRALGDQYRALTNLTARVNFVKEHATCYTQLSHLPYFDLVQQIVIDHMHNLFLGLVKTHFYHIWVQNKILQPNHELTKLHELLADVSTVTNATRLYHFSPIFPHFS
ncbi:hypothetical protein OG21DRAFT_1569135 [Imleria badia]|nr:hypothetical protein OG21DRAFT_1569135 [Imleria badia]